MKGAAETAPGSFRIGVKITLVLTPFSNQLPDGPDMLRPF